MNRLLVTGASGILGSSVIATLQKKLPASQISIITRNAENYSDFQRRGFQAYIGDYNNTVALEEAMENVDTVLLISSGDQGDRMQEHKNVIDIATKTGVNHIAYTSRALHDRSTLVNKLMLDHFRTEDYIKASGLAYTVFRNSLYMEAIYLFVGGSKALERGIFQPAGDGKVAFALRTELGEAIANVLLDETPENKTYMFTGARAYSFYDIAATLQALSGKEVNYMDVDCLAFHEMMKNRGLTEIMINKIIDFNTDIKHNQEAYVSNDLELKLGRKPTSLEDGLKLIFGL